MVAEGWWHPYSPDRLHLLYSLSKSFTSTAAGFAAAEGLLDLDATVVSLLPRVRGGHHRSTAAADAGPARRRDGQRARDGDVASRGRRPTREPVRGVPVHPAGPRARQLSSRTTSPALTRSAAIVQRTAGMPPHRVPPAAPVRSAGRRAGGLVEHPAGREHRLTAGCMPTTEAVADLGQLHLQRGVGRASSCSRTDWVAEATRRQCRARRPRSRHPDWRAGLRLPVLDGRHGYRGDGAFGQFCMILPEHDAVIAMTSRTQDMQAVLDAVWRHLLPALDRDPIDSAAQNKLALRLGDLHLQAYEMAPQPVDWGAWSLAVFAVTSAGGDTALQSSLTALRATGCGAAADPQGNRQHAHVRRGHAWLGDVDPRRRLRTAHSGR